MVTVNPATIFSILGNPKSRIPLLIKDTTSTAGVTVSSYVTGKEEGQDRLIDEVATEAIWLGGIPFYQTLYDKTIFKLKGLDHKYDARNLKNQAIYEKTKELAPTEEIKQNIEKIGKNKKIFEHLATGKFFISTGLSLLTYFGITKLKHKYTENKIKHNLINEYNNSKSQTDNNNTQKTNKQQVAFKGVGKVIEDFANNPVKNMWLIDGGITGERLWNSRSPQEFCGYAIKEGSLLCFMYIAGDQIRKYCENRADKKYNKSIGLDARILESEEFKKSFEDKSIEKSLQEFESIKKSSSNPSMKDEVSLYEFLHKNPNNMIVKSAKNSDIIKTYKDTGKIDTREYIDLQHIEDMHSKIKKLYSQYNDAIKKGTSSNDFFKDVKKLKRSSILVGLGSAMFALGILTPGVMLLKRFLSKDDKEFQTKKDIREKLIKDGVIA